MEISFLRSSSINTWESYCQHKYYLVYGLGLEDPPNIKTEKGTIVHGCLEALAGMKKSFQECGVYRYEHQGIGIFECSAEEFLKPTTLTDQEVDAINKSRKNKETYKDQIKVEYGHTRYGVKVVEELLKKMYDYYSSKSHHDWGNIEWRDCLNFTWMTLDWSDGMFDARKRKIIHPELPFNIEIKKDWAILPNGEYLRIKGTIDLVTEIEDGIIECIDYKTGQRYDWGTGKIKSYDDLMKDEQLMLYYYALRHSLPEYHSVMLTIFFMRDGGPFTMAFDDDTLERVEKNLRRTFESIRDTKIPLQRDRFHNQFQCKTLCGFFKQKVDGKTCVCDHIHNDIKLYGIEKASEKNKKKGFEVSKYCSPGE